MKKRMYLFIVLFMGAHSLYAQDCATGYCPSTIVVHHKAGDLSPTGVDITYGVVAIGSNCWLAQNLGASTSTSTSSYTPANMGWFYQWGSKKGYDMNVSVAGITSSYTNTSLTWTAANDPCTLTLGSAWHVPAASEMSAVPINTLGGAAVAGKLSYNVNSQIRDGGSYAIIQQYNGSNANSGNDVGCGWLNSAISATAGSTWGMISSQSSSTATWINCLKYTGLPVRCVKLASN